uniref:Uncharacterized protein n=1 Tax=Graphocephala atropunctata TaxID=36148 RepID=A0A1B6KF46_9HEMI
MRNDLAMASNLPLNTNENKVISPEVKENILVKNETISTNNATYMWTTQLNPNAITTGFYILAGLSSLIIVYFIFKAIRLRRRNYKVRRYGVIASREDVEMTPLENEDDDEDSTVFDISMKTHTRS